MKDDKNRSDTLAALKDRVTKARERLDSLVTQNPRGVDGSKPAAEPLPSPCRRQHAKVKKPVTIPSTKDAADHVRAGRPFGNMTIAASEVPKPQRMSNRRRTYFTGVVQNSKQ